MDGWIDGWIDGWMDGWMGRREITEGRREEIGTKHRSLVELD